MIVCRDLNNLPKFSNSVITIGSFDGVHSGHRKLLDNVIQKAKRINGDSILITFDSHPRQVIYPKDKDLKLLTSIDEKLELLEDTGLDYVVIVPFTIEFSQINPREYIEDFLIKNFNPNHIVIGYDHKYGLNRAGDITLLREYEQKFEFTITEVLQQEIDDIAISSTKIRQALIDGDIVKSNRFLTKPFMIKGKVVKGAQLGRKIGYPTANIKPSNPLKLIPADGVYATTVRYKDRLLNGMLYIGMKPTIEGSTDRVIEINIFDFDEDIYDLDLTLYLHNYIREDMKFDHLDGLKVQLAKDETTARSILELKAELDAKAKIAIAILNYNGLEYLESFLPLMTDSYSQNAPIYVIDNCSTDESVAYIEEWHPEIKLIKLDKNYGFAEGYNIGIKDIDAELIALVNSDVQATDYWLDPIVELMDNSKDTACVQPKIRSLESKDSFEYAGAAGGFIDIFNYPFCRGRVFDHIELDQQQYDNGCEIFWASGAALVIRKELMENFGGFDKDFFAHQEEIDLCWRLKNAGYQIKYEPKSTIFHLGGGTLNYNHPRKIYLNFRNSFVSIFKNESFFNLFWKVPFRFILDLTAMVFFIIKGEFKASKSVARALFYFITHPFSMLKKRRLVRDIVKQNKVGNPNTSGRLNKSIILSYFLLGHKTFSRLVG